ncbi:hypothetical protein Taro_012309 [Colocasia esculenta]|uniref:AP2/ERF domain-containing protein n=1 Tax=Colocasia esculenta TaxID=4460 RepID=A0A843UCJ1_COLES|nr:hypothetical protein [Colocasia esculenta]
MGKNSRSRAGSSCSGEETDRAGSGGGCDGGVAPAKAKRTRRSLPRESPAQRSSVYRGVTRHRWTGRYEAHLWDKNCWNESQNKKGRQGAYDDEEAAAHAYDLAALKYWGEETILNFPLSTYQEELKEMEGLSKEEYIGSIRRKSSGFSRGVSKYRGVARHHHNGRWEARIGRVFGNKYLYLGTYATQEEAAMAYDMAAIEYRGLNAVTNFDLSRYIKWLRPCPGDPSSLGAGAANGGTALVPSPDDGGTPGVGRLQDFYGHLDCGTGDASPGSHSQAAGAGASASSALGILLQSAKFKEMLERTTSSLAEGPPTPPGPGHDQQPPRGCFPEDVRTFFDGPDGNSGFADEDDVIFGDLDSLMSIFHCELDC